MMGSTCKIGSMGLDALFGPLVIDIRVSMRRMTDMGMEKCGGLMVVGTWGSGTVESSTDMER